MNRTKLLTNNGSSIDAAALQSDIARRFNLPGSKFQNNVRLSSKSSGSKNQQNPNKFCQSCGSINPNNSSTCRSCGFYLSGIQRETESLAQRRGLVKAQPTENILTPVEWEEIEQKLRHRLEAHCPICMEGFNQGHEVLLSCSHMFHRACLSSFETFMEKSDKGPRACPICRTTSYQKKITQQGSLAFQNLSSIKIQRIWRGFAARKLYQFRFKCFYQNQRAMGKNLNLRQRKKYCEVELSHWNERMKKETEQQNEEVDKLIISSESALKESREVDELFDQLMRERAGNRSEMTRYYQAHPTLQGEGEGEGEGERRDVIRDQEMRSLLGLSYGYENDNDDQDYYDQFSPSSSSTTTTTTTSIFDPMREGGGRSSSLRGDGVDPSQINWEDVSDRACIRGLGECAICMNHNLPPGWGDREPIESAPPPRPLSLLSCSHVYHTQCLENFERFCRGEQSCPVCRSPYLRIPLPLPVLQSIRKTEQQQPHPDPQNQVSSSNPTPSSTQFRTSSPAISSKSSSSPRSHDSPSPRSFPPKSRSISLSQPLAPSPASLKTSSIHQSVRKVSSSSNSSSTSSSKSPSGSAIINRQEK